MFQVGFLLVSLLFPSNVWICVLVAVSGEGVAVVCVSGVPTRAPGDAEEDSQLSQHQR